MKEEILEFLDRRFQRSNPRREDPCNWLTGNCYWMAMILASRFNLEVYYDPVVGHFFVGESEEGPFYDWHGETTPVRHIKLRNLREMDEAWYNRLMRDCRC